MKSKKIKYSEPSNYFPKEIRKKYGLGEYEEAKKPKKKVVKKSGTALRIWPLLGTIVMLKK